VGLRYALHDPECGYCWLLNNDTVVKTNALSALLQTMKQHPEVGLCGSLNLSYYTPSLVQAQGGKSYQRWLGRVRSPPLVRLDEIHAHPTRIDFVNGASMLASRDFLEKVGLMEESYFLYFEELDWAMRTKGKFDLGYAPESVVYHKEGAQIGSHQDRMKRSLLSEKYLTRSRILFTKRHIPLALPSVLATVLLASAYRLFRGDPGLAKAILSSALRALQGNNVTTESACTTE
jgi:hypothetical protein